jgi:hypothetical protein
VAAEELVLEEWVIRLDGNAVELLHKRQAEVEALFAEARKRREKLA